ncbi:HK97 family phage prohead protease [Lentzea kentuckyensis]|uniref:HK97 family phage prohead protease n=1 Tax=Lentzea kentuckyensis TaxID=360086 RepID=UPI000A3D4F9C|nr:HK97 family phage prohead protease [Lentzea kentuckyensis]
MHIKTAPVTIKAAGTQDGTAEGVFEAIVSAFNNVDSYGDVVLPGAFTDTLADWKASGDPIPVLWSHAANDPDYHIGYVLEAEERAEGLWVRAQLDPDDLAETRSKTSKIYRLLKGRRVTQFSFAFDVIDAGWGERDDRDVYELRKLKLYEVGPCLIGVNQATSLLDIKARKEGPPVRPATADTTKTDNTHDDKATPATPEPTPDPSTVATPEPVHARSGTASARLRTDIALLEVDVLTLTN